MTTKTKTIDEAVALHPSCYIDVIERAEQDGAGHDAIYVWASEEDAEDDDGSLCVAIYWLAEPAKTVAQQIADDFDNDGMRFTSDAGEFLFDVLESRCSDKDRNWEREATRFNFDDGSSIVVSGLAWDLGTDRGCHCWEGAGHTAECDAAHADDED